MSKPISGLGECLAVLLDGRLGVLPDPAPAEATIQFWQQWLARHHLGLVAVADPAAFEWAGSWIATVRGGRGLRAILMFGLPSGSIFDPNGVGTDEADVSIVGGFVVAPLGAAFLREPHAPDPSRAGTVAALFVAPAAEARLERTGTARALAGRGLEGDRYAIRAGTFGRNGGTGYDLTLIEAEALEELERNDGILLEWAAARRNVVTRGIDLNALVGSHFRVGEVECYGQRLAEPCAHLQRLTLPGVLRGLVHRAGLRADVLSDGIVRVGDEVRQTGDAVTGARPRAEGAAPSRAGRPRSR